jgi:hypothetical protein
MQLPPMLAAYMHAPDGRPIREIDADIVDELTFHIEMRTQDNLRTGMTPEAARSDALSRFGDFNRTHRRCRRILLGDRIMLQRLQTVLTVALLGAVVYLAVGFYGWQRSQAAVTAKMLASLEQIARKQDTLDAIAAESRSNPADAAPSVVQTVPKIDDRNADSSLTEIRVTYNRRMMDGNWSWCYDPDQLKTTGKPRYEADGRTCVLPVKLEPGKTYMIWLNTDTFRNFKDTAGRPAVPYGLRFATRK